MQKDNKNKRGFSFLEMVIIVAIISIMTSVMLVVTFQERDKKEIEAAAREVTAAIREAQNYALTGKQQGLGLPCAFGFFIPDEHMSGDEGEDSFKVMGSYRTIDSSCGAEYDYVNSYTTVFSSKNLGAEGLEIFGFTSNQHVANSGNFRTPFVAFDVPYGRYYDYYDYATEVNNVLMDESIGTEFVVREEGQTDNEYHICVHDTGLIEEIGFVARNSSNEADAVGLACVF